MISISFRGPTPPYPTHCQSAPTVRLPQTDGASWGQCSERPGAQEDLKEVTSSMGVEELRIVEVNGGQRNKILCHM